MVMAAGLGTRLRPLTYDVPKPMVPVANRPVIEHLLRLLAGQEITEVIANLHWFPETITDHLGDGSGAVELHGALALEPRAHRDVADRAISSGALQRRSRGSARARRRQALPLTSVKCGSPAGGRLLLCVYC